MPRVPQPRRSQERITAGPVYVSKATVQKTAAHRDTYLPSKWASAALQSGMVHGIGAPAQANKSLQRSRLPECLVQKKTAAHFEALVGALLAASRSRF